MTSGPGLTPWRPGSVTRLPASSVPVRDGAFLRPPVPKRSRKVVGLHVLGISEAVHRGPSLNPPGVPWTGWQV
jgi:hypothetical protein